MNPVIQYGVSFVVGVVTPKNAFKTLIAANKPLVLIDASIKQYTKSIKHLTPLLQKSIAANFAWKDALFPIGLVNLALRRLVGTTRFATNQMAAELRAFTPRLLAAFNPMMALQSIAALSPLLTPIIQQTAQLGGTWESTRNLVVDNAAAMGVMSSQYAALATQVAKFGKSEQMIATITNTSIDLAAATGILPQQLTLVVDEIAKLSAVARLSSVEMEGYGQALTAITTKLPVTVDYLTQFTTTNASLIKSNQLSIEEVTAYGTAFEQLGLAANKGGSVFQKLINIIQTPGDMAAKGITGFEQLGFTIEDITNLTSGEGGLNNALQVLLTRIQGIANTNPAAAVQALSSLLGEDSDRGAGAQSIVALANNLGSLQSAMTLLNDSSGNAELSQELLDIAAQADPVGNLNAAFQGLTETWGTVLQPLVLTLANELAGLVNGISAAIAGGRDGIRAVMETVVNFSRVLDNTLRIIKPLIFYWSVYNATIATSKLLAIGLANVTKFLLAKNLFGLAVVTGFLSRQFNLFYVFMASKFIPLLQSLAVESINALPTAIWTAFINGVKALPGVMLAAGKSMVAFGKTALVALKSAYFAIAPFLPLIIATTAAILTVRAVYKTFAATVAQARDIRGRIEAINETSEALSETFRAVGINADGSLSKTKNILQKVATAAGEAMEKIRDNASIFEHIGNAIGNERLAAFKFATQAEASAAQAAIAYGDLLVSIDKYGSTYNQVVAKIRANPTDHAALEAGNSMLEILRQQKKTLESLEVTKDQAASKQAYIKSLDQQIRYISKLSVGNDELKNSIDQADVSVEHLQQTLDNLRNKVSEARQKEVDKEIEGLQKAADLVEETESAKVEAANSAAQKEAAATEKLIQRQQQLEDRQIDRRRALEDAAIADRQEAEDKALQKRYDAEDARLQESFDNREAAIEKQQAAEDAAIEKALVAETKAIEQLQAVEDKALEKQQAAEDKAISRRQELEDSAISRRIEAEDKALQKRYEAEDAALTKQQDLEDKARTAQYEAEDKALQQSLDAELAAIETATAAREQAINLDLKLREDKLKETLDKELAAIEATLTARETALAKELATREELIKLQTDTGVNNLAAQQDRALQAAEEAFNQRQRQQDAAYETNKQRLETAHKTKLLQAEAAAQTRLQQLEETFNTRLLDKQLAAVETKKKKEVDGITAREELALAAFDRQQQLDAADSPEERARLQAEFEQADKIEAQRQAIRDKYEAERRAKELEAAKVAEALEAEKAKKQEALAKAKEIEEEKAAAAKAKLEAEAKAAQEKLDADREAAKQAAQAAYEKQQEELKLAFETRIETLKAEAETKLQELRTANELKLTEARDAAEKRRLELQQTNEKLLEEAKLATEEKIAEQRAAAEKQSEELKLKNEEEKAKRDLTREAEKEQRDLAREADREKREIEREQAREQRELAREEAKRQLDDEREAQATKLADEREAMATARAEERDAARALRQEQIDSETAARQEQRELAKEKRQESFEAAADRRAEQREQAKETRDKQREQAAYQRQIAREDEDYARQLKREEEAAARQELVEEAKKQRDEQYELEKAKRQEALNKEIADKEAALAKELEVIKLQTQESIEQSYGEITTALKATAKEISDAARAANAASAPKTPPPGRRYRGGAVRAGMPYWVGEDKTTGRLTPNSELFIPKTDGYVANASQVWGMIRAARYAASRTRVVSTTANNTLNIKPLIAEIASIRTDVNKLSRTVNPRTNQLRTVKHTLPTKTYEIH